MTGRDATITEIIVEFSEVFAFARTRWARYAEEVSPDLRGVGMMVLQTIVRKAPITATELSSLLDMDKAVVSRQVSKLRELGLVEATPAEEDRRVSLLTITPEAERTLDDMRARNASAYHERFDGWTEGDLASLRDGLRRFNEAPHGTREESAAARCARSRPQG